MGFDVYGINPMIHKQKEEFKTLYKYDVTIGESKEGQDNWSLKWNKLDSASKRTKNCYWKQHGEFEAVNPGVYFRNNVWCWRPLWDYVCGSLDCLTQEDWNEGHTNNGHLISEEKAVAIADFLDYALRSGGVEEYADEYRMRQEDTKFEYPFYEENVREFAIFCHDSGGFKIS